MENKYRQALETLYSLTDYTRQGRYPYSPDRFDLRRVERFLAWLGNPQHRFRAVHIAGTKGKGSTSAMIASILQQAGYRTGLYTSPHLHTFRERIQVNGAPIPEQEVVAGVDRLRPLASQIPQITTFEVITALAFDYLARQQVDWAVVEVGMGGRLDATNVITPKVTVLTPISYDHMLYLGHTLPEIAGEKAGIIKSGVPTVSAPQPAEAEAVFERIAAERDAPWILVGRDWHWESLAISSSGQEFAVWPTGGSRETYMLPLLGRHQQVNAVTAVAAIDQLRRSGTDVSQEAIHEGLAAVRWPGRLEVLGREPWVIVDGAHNGDSMQKLIAAIHELFSFQQLILIWGSSADKDLDRMLDAILPAADRVLVTRAPHPRAADPELLAERIGAHGGQAEVVPIEDALSRALDLAGKQDLICGTGSLFLVAALRSQWFTRQGQPLTALDPE